MGRSTRKGPYIEERLEKRVEELNRQRQKKVLKTWLVLTSFAMTSW